MAKIQSEIPEETDESALRYRAPALEKGLDIIELLAASPRPMSPKNISEQLNRSVSELFRMVQVLENRGYVAMASNQSGYEVTNKLFSLGLARGISKNLLDHAIPVMRALGEDILQACYLAVASDDQVVVIGQMDAPAAPSFHIRVGYRQGLVESVAGAVLYAFQRPRVQAAWRDALVPSMSTDEWSTFQGLANQAFADGYLAAKSPFSESITDISCPVFSDRGLVAALTVPHIKSKLSVGVQESAQALAEACLTLSHTLGAPPSSQH